jgi:hypothetical protein
VIENFYEPSRIYDLGLPDLPDMEIGSINGMANFFEDAQKSARHLSRLAGGYNVHAVYNATHGKPHDLLECGMGLNYIATEPVRQLHKMWNSFFNRASASAKYLMICHSQGAIHVRNALLDYPPALRERILVVAIAPGGYIYQQTCAKVIHYRATPSRDGIPRLDGSGAKREKNTIVDLASDSGAPWHDHAFMSPTYRRVIWEHITEYIVNNGRNL